MAAKAARFVIDKQDVFTVHNSEIRYEMLARRRRFGNAEQRRARINPGDRVCQVGGFKRIKWLDFKQLGAHAIIHLDADGTLLGFGSSFTFWN